MIINKKWKERQIYVYSNIGVFWRVNYGTFSLIFLNDSKKIMPLNKLVITGKNIADFNPYQSEKRPTIAGAKASPKM